MRRLVIFLLLLHLLMLANSCNQVFVVKAPDGFDLELTETANVNVNCTTAQVSTISMVMSYNTSLVHFPSGVDMGRTELMNATGISLIFSTAQSFLLYMFNNTSLAAAQSFADAVKPSIETAFNTAFTWNSIGQIDSEVNVTYTGAGKANLTQYTEWLMSQCLAPSLGGFSLTFLPMTYEPDAFSSLSAYKEVSGFDWAYSMMTGYVMSIPKGSGNHRIDILDLLDVDSLAPSSYANAEGTYTSNVMLTISSNQTITYVSSEPDLASPPEQPRGWMSIPFTPPNTLIYYFSFADDPSPVSPLSLTFSGIVIPEFRTLLSVILLVLTALIAVVIRKRFL